MKNRHTVKVIMEDGNDFITDINGKMQEVKQYYLGNRFEMDECKPMVRCVGLQLISEATDGSGYPYMSWSKMEAKA